MLFFTEISKMKILIPNFKRYFNLVFFSLSYAQGFKFFLTDCPLLMKVLPFNFDRNEGRLTPFRGGKLDKVVFLASYAVIIVYTGFFLWKALGYDLHLYTRQDMNQPCVF